jgi:hypothetical protein
MLNMDVLNGQGEQNVDDMVYTVIRVQALSALDDMFQEADQMEPGPRARRVARLRATIGRRLIRLGTLLAGPSRMEPRKQTQTA